VSVIQVSLGNGLVAEFHVKYPDETFVICGNCHKAVFRREAIAIVVLKRPRGSDKIVERDEFYACSPECKQELYSLRNA